MYLANPTPRAGSDPGALSAAGRDADAPAMA
jgi:hypothetical protein